MVYNYNFRLHGCDMDKDPFVYLRQKIGETKYVNIILSNRDKCN